VREGGAMGGREGENNVGKIILFVSKSIDEFKRWF